MNDAVELLKSLIRFPSLSGEEAEIAAFMEAHVARAGLEVSRLEDNVYFYLGTGSRRLLLNSHLDVVPPSASHPYDPFDPVVKNGWLYGRGSVDAKASGAAMTTAVLQLAAEGYTPRNGQVIVALTVCEETGEDRNGLLALRPHLPPIHAALVGEPTEMQPAIAQKGLLILQVRARGRTAHAARAHLGENAILNAVQDIERLRSLRFDDMETPLMTVTTISGGTARNVVPDLCSFYVDIRTTPRTPHDEVIRRVSAHLESEVHVHSSRIGPVSTSESERIVQSCLAAIPSAVPFMSDTASDWLFLADIPTVKIGPGASERSHTADERILIFEVHEAVDQFKRIVRHFFDQ